MKEILVQIFDDNANELGSMELAFAGLLEAAGIPARIETRVLSIQETGIVREVEAVRPDLIILDNQFGSSIADKSYGQQLISMLKPKLPDALFVLATKEEFKEGSFGRWHPHADILVSKIHVENLRKPGYEKYAEWLTNEISYGLKRSRIDVIDFAAIKDSIAELRSRPAKGQGRSRSIHAVEVASLVEQTCHTGGPIQENVIQGARLELVTGGKSDAVVCAISVQNKYGDFNVPAVIKFMDRDATRREIHNHAKFVKWTLPYRWKVDVIGSGVTEDFGAVCYSFAHGGSGRPNTLSELIVADDRQIVSSVMNAVFNVDSAAWYSKQRVNSNPLSNYLSADAPYFPSPSAFNLREQMVHDLVGAMAKVEDVAVITAGTSTLVQFASRTINLSSLVRDFASDKSIPTTVECICHGDLNSGNIMVRSGSSEFSFIDFQHTGWHHRARDFCSLEGSVRTLERLDAPNSLSSKIEEEIARIERMVEDRLVSEKGVDLIDEIRCHFMRNHPDATVSEYVLANMVHTWWLLSFSKTWNDFQVRRLLACFLAQVYWLQRVRVDDGLGLTK